MLDKLVRNKYVLYNSRFNSRISPDPNGQEINSGNSVQRAVHIPVASKLYQLAGQDPPQVTVSPGQDTRPSDCPGTHFLAPNPLIKPAASDQRQKGKRGRQEYTTGDRQRSAPDTLIVLNLLLGARCDGKLDEIAYDTLNVQELKL